MKGEVREGGNERKEQRERHRVRQRPFQDPEGSEAPAPPHASGCMAPRKPGPVVRKESPLSKPCPGPGDLKFSRAKHCGKRRLSNHMIRHSLSYLFPASGFPPLANRTEQSWGGRGRGAVHRGGKHPNLSDCRGLGPGRGDGGACCNHQPWADSWVLLELNTTVVPSGFQVPVWGPFAQPSPLPVAPALLQPRPRSARRSPPGTSVAISGLRALAIHRAEANTRGFGAPSPLAQLIF